MISLNLFLGCRGARSILEICVAPEILFFVILAASWLPPIASRSIRLLGKSNAPPLQDDAGARERGEEGDKNFFAHPVGRVGIDPPESLQNGALLPVRFSGSRVPVHVRTSGNAARVSQ